MLLITVLRWMTYPFGTFFSLMLSKCLLEGSRDAEYSWGNVRYACHRLSPVRSSLFELNWKICPEIAIITALKGLSKLQCVCVCVFLSACSLFLPTFFFFECFFILLEIFVSFRNRKVRLFSPWFSLTLYESAMLSSWLLVIGLGIRWHTQVKPMIVR